jgi:cardiolipin synthase
MAIDARTLQRAWQLCRAAGVNLFRGDASARIAETRGLSSLGLTGAPDAVQTTLVASLRAMEIIARDVVQGMTRPSLVATLPIPAREAIDTRGAIRALIRSARRELLVVGFSITDDDFRELLIAQGMAGLKVCVVSDRVQKGARHLAQRWPTGARPLLALENVEPAQGEFSQMHGKTVVADRARALVGSANFTAGGFRNNLEFGLLVEGDVAEQICRVVERLHRERWLLELQL